LTADRLTNSKVSVAACSREYGTITTESIQGVPEIGIVCTPYNFISIDQFSTFFHPQNQEKICYH